MPLASMLEMNKPFVFAPSHTDETSTEQLASPTTTTNKTSLPRPPPMDNNNTTTNTAKLPPASPLDRGLYYSSSSSIPSDHHHHDTHLEHAPPPPHPTSMGSSNYQDHQPPPSSRLNGYHYPAKSVTTDSDRASYPSSSSTSTATTLNSQLLSSPSTPTTATPATPSTTTTTTTTTTTISHQQRSSFSSHLPGHRHQQDSTSSISLPPQPTTTTATKPFHKHDVNHIDHHHSIKKESAPNHVMSSSLPQLPPPSAIATATPILAPPPPPPPLADRITLSTTVPPPTKRPAGQGDEGDSGYFDSSATDNRRVKRRKELNQKIDALNHDFLINKERIFAEKLLVVQNEVSQAHNNTHTQYKEGLILLESIRQKTIEDGRLLRDYQTQVTDNQFTLEIQRAEEEYMAEKNEVREKLFAVLEEKRRKLKDDKDNCDLAYDVVLESQTRMNKRNLRKRGMENGDGKLNKRKQVSGPALIFRLKDEEVYDDLQAMRNGLSTQTKKSSTSKKK